jgi:hypothetical protein
MHPRERVLEQARLCQLRGQPVPVDLLAEADALGISLTQMGQPHTTTTVDQKPKEINEWLDQR